MHKPIILTTLLGLLSSLNAETFKSPNGSLTADLFISEKNQLTYSVSRKGKTVIEPSALGITIDGVSLGMNATLGQASKTFISESYPFTGHKAKATNIYNSVTIPLSHESGTYTLDLRLYDEAFAWRYNVPGTGLRTINGETSSFKVPAESKVWFMERRNAWKLKSYAGEWISAAIADMPTVSPTGPVQGFPLIIEQPGGGYSVLTESAVFNYSGMRAEAIGNNTFQANFTEGEKGFPLDGKITTPWRAIISVDSLDELVNQTIVSNLAPAPDPKLFSDTSWIQPGWSVWRWQLQGIGLPSHQERFTKYAEQLGWPYNLIDDGWEYDWPEPWARLKEICDKARKSDVRIWVWKRSSDTEDPANNFEQLRRWLDQVVAAGAVGVKFDFFDAEDLATRRYEEAVLREAAKRKLMINFHGCPKPTGESRTYPNEVTREGIRGLELNFIRSEGLLSPSHNAALPFTRLIVGHGDYTPITFQPGNLGNTTIAHQLATAVLMTSPMQVLNAIPSNVIHHPQTEISDFLKTLPTVWDETRVLPGSKIGDLAILARRKGDTWWVAALNGGEAKDYELSLSFLGGNEYNTRLITDSSASPFTVAFQELKTSEKQKLKIQLPVGGGFVARLQP